MEFCRSLDTIRRDWHCQTSGKNRNVEMMMRWTLRFGTNRGELVMNRATLVLLGTVATLLAGISIGARAPAAAEETAVRATVEAYLHGLKFNDVDSFTGIGQVRPQEGILSGGQIVFCA
jgi:hypothetical protein